jgi:hypothetical protein
MILKFEEWLIEQQQREDFVGDLARAPDMRKVDHKPSRRKSDEHKYWADIVIRLAQPGQVAAFNDAWQEFLLEKQAAEESAH